VEDLEEAMVFGNGIGVLAGTLGRFDEDSIPLKSLLSPISMAWQNSTMKGIKGVSNDIVLQA